MKKQNSAAICEAVDLSKQQTIQDFGALMIVNKSTMKVESVSENISIYLQSDPKRLLSQSISDIFSKQTVRSVEKVIRDKTEIILTLRGELLLDGDERLDRLFNFFYTNDHLYFEFVAFELEPSDQLIFDLDKSINLIEQAKKENQLYISCF